MSKENKMVFNKFFFGRTPPRPHRLWSRAPFLVRFLMCRNPYFISKRKAQRDWNFGRPGAAGGTGHGGIARKLADAAPQASFAAWPLFAFVSEQATFPANRICCYCALSADARAWFTGFGSCGGSFRACHNSHRF
jgi:hypothetical protein